MLFHAIVDPLTNSQEHSGMSAGNVDPQISLAFNRSGLESRHFSTGDILFMSPNDQLGSLKEA